MQWAPDAGRGLQGRGTPETCEETCKELGSLPPGFWRSLNSTLCLLDTPQTSILCKARASSERRKEEGEGPTFSPSSPLSICRAVHMHQKEEVQGPG